MAKLKNFNNVNDFQNFIKSDEFVEPDISTINHTQTQYMPVDVLQLNVKEKLSPNEENFKALINTNNNGKVNVWYKKSTASNYTKLNTNDIVYTSGYTQHLNEITFNTVNSQLDNTSNMIYVVSGRNDTNTSMTISKEIIQYGLITLDGTTFDATGGSKTIQLKTEASNVWKIIGVPAWLSFSKTSGVGPASITVTAEEYTTTTIDRSTYVILSYNINGITYQINSNAIIQTKADTPTPPPEPKYFYIGNSVQNAISPNYTYPTNIPANVVTGGTNFLVYYKTNYDTSELTLSPATDTTANFDHNLNRIYFNVTKNNEDTTPKTFTINVKHNGTTVGTLTVNQSAAEAKYFKWSNNQQNISYTTSSASTSLTETFTTNYSAVTFEWDVTVITNVSKNNGSINYTVSENLDESERTGYVYAKYNNVTVGTLTISQNAVEAKYFKWSNGQQQNTRVVSSATTTGISETFTTNYPNIRFECDGTVVTNVSSGNNIIRFNVSQNPDVIVRIGLINAYNGTNHVGTLTVNQSAAEEKYFKWSNGQQDITEIDVISASTTLSENFTTNYSAITFECDGTVCTAVTKNSNFISYTVSENPDESERTGYVYAKYNNVTVGTLTAIQQPGEKDYSSQYLTFILKENGFISWKTYAEGNEKTIYYSKDNGLTWSSVTSNYDSTPIILVNANEPIIFKGNNNSYARISYEEEYRNSFVSYVEHEVEGNIMSLIYGDDFIGKTSFPDGSKYNLSQLFFDDRKLVSAENLVLPARNLPEECYYDMFSNCTSLKKPPKKLEPATALGKQCYCAMFAGCTSLIETPRFNLNTVSSGCCDDMFSYCTSLVNANNIFLSVTTLANYCYNRMFYGCTSLVSAPELPATTLVDYCYQSMFQGCTSLVTAPELPATTLANYCYQSMFNGCTNLTTAPELPATTLAFYCYYYMFSGCGKLNYIKCLSQTPLSSSYATGWVNSVASTGTFIKDANTTHPIGNYGIPNGWIIQNA